MFEILFLVSLFSSSSSSNIIMAEVQIRHGVPGDLDHIVDSISKAFG